MHFIRFLQKSGNHTGRHIKKCHNPKRSRATLQSFNFPTKLRKKLSGFGFLWIWALAMVSAGRCLPQCVADVSSAPGWYGGAGNATAVSAAVDV